MSLFISVGVEKTAFYFDRLFDYEVPDQYVDSIELGCLVSVYFGNSNKLRQAIVLKISNSSSEKCKPILGVLSKGSVISIDLLKVVKFLHQTCFCTWFEAVKTVLPSGCFFKICSVWSFHFNDSAKLSESELDFALKLKCFFENSKQSKFNSIVNEVLEGEFKDVAAKLLKKGFIFKKSVFKRRLINKPGEKVVLNCDSKSNLKLTAKQQLLFNYIVENGSVFAKKACYDCGVSGVVLKNLASKGLIRFEVDYDSCEHVNNFNLKNVGLGCVFKLVDKIVLNDQQKQAFLGLTEILKKREAKAALLRGVTGSGKTIVFLKLIDFVLKRGEQVILLVPEIALTPQMVNFFRSFFGDLVSVLHSGLTLTQQLYEHDRIKINKAKLIIGTRSAVFAPCAKLGLIVMDEEGESTYKNKDASPRYHARDVAWFRCLKFKTLLLLASATPSIETQYFAKIGRYAEFVLSRRFKNAILPKVVVVDLKKAKESPVYGLSLFFYNELLKNLERKEQTIILLNRRGYNSSVVCLDCGFKMSCSNCSALLTYHAVNDSLICHYCGRIQKAKKMCKECGSCNLNYFGQGTQKIEQELALKFQNAKILRLDSDSVYSRVDLEKKIQKFEEGYYDILVGTQIVAKGLNFNNVTLVGVVSIDNLLYGSDFRNSEQVFSLLTQVVGRGGRGEKLGRAVIQTYSPKNSTILKAASQNYEKFYMDEIRERKLFLCPPFCDLCVVNFSGFNQKRVEQCAREFIMFCRNNVDLSVPINVLGIATPFIEKLNKRFRKRVIIKCKNGVKFRRWIAEIAKKVFSLKLFSGIRTNIDMNGEIL